MNIQTYRSYLSDNPPPFRFTSGNEHTLELLTDRAPSFDSTEAFTLCAGIKDSVAFEIGYSVPEVEAVFAKNIDNRVMHVWAVVPTYDRRVYRSIYAREKKIIEQFGGVDFDFNVVASNGRQPRQLISDPEVDLTYLRR